MYPSSFLPEDCASKLFYFTFLTLRIFLFSFLLSNLKPFCHKSVPAHIKGLELDYF